MIDWLGWLRKLEFTTVAALAIAGLRDALANRQTIARFDGIDYSATGALKGRIQAAAPCKVGD